MHLRSKHATAALFGLLLAGLSHANPIAIESGRRTISMIAEKVTVAVSLDQSLVTGDYTFRQERSNWSGEKDTHVTIYVPVLLPTDKDEIQYSPPVVSVGSTRLSEFVDRERSRGEDTGGEEISSDIHGLPKNWMLKAYQYRIPLPLLRPTFSITVTYSQPSFPGHIAAYLPIEPPTQRGAGLITFRAEAGHALKPYNARFFFHPAYPSLDFVPKNGELIRVKCVRASGL